MKRERVCDGCTELNTAIGCQQKVHTAIVDVIVVVVVVVECNMS